MNKFVPMGRYLSVCPIENDKEEEVDSNFDFTLMEDVSKKNYDRFVLVEVIEVSSHLESNAELPTCKPGDILVAEATQVFEIKMPNGEATYALSPQYVVGKIE